MAAPSKVVIRILLLALTSPEVAAISQAALKGFSSQRPGGRAVTTQLSVACDGSGLSATVIRPGDANYNASRSQFATASATSAIADSRTKPQMIIYCSTDAHVQEAVSLAKACGFTLSARSGGHNYAAFSSCPTSSPLCIQVDLSAMETFSVNSAQTPAQVTIGSGLTLEQVYANLVPYGLAVPGGICKTVGVGGHYQSSGAGYYLGAFGLGIDVVKSFRIVLADGEVHTVDTSSDPELYWAALGGGPGSWGIVLDYTLDTFADADYPHMQTFTFFYPYSRPMMLAVSSIYTTHFADPLVERDMGILFNVYDGAPWGQGTTTFIMIRFIWMGIDNGPLTGTLYDTYYKPYENLPHLTAMPLTPLPISVFPGLMASAWDFSVGGPYRYHIHAFGMRSNPTSEFWSAVCDELDARIAIPNLSFSWQINPYGGQTDRYAGQNAYMMRGVKHWVDDWVFFLGDSMAQVAEQRILAFREATGHMWEEDNVAHSWMTPDTLVDSTHSSAADFAMNESWFARLQDVKTRVDPTDMFRSSRTIPPMGLASGVGDPHLQNIYGERFDLMQPGRHTLIEIPRHAAAQSVLLLVEAEARHDGLACADVYFKTLNITGAWSEAKKKGGLHFYARDATSTESGWMSFGKVDLKIAHGRTQQGTRYLNVYVKHLSQSGFAIGGLLGEDDHVTVATPLKSCQRAVSLVQTPSAAADLSVFAASRAEASMA